jgi:[ribosomal protein S5]-alanine N-acetyltransferase
MLETNSKKALHRRRSPKRPLRLDPEGEKMWISGRHIFLRGLDETDIDSHYVNWLNDPEVNIFMATRRFPTTRESLKNFYEKIKSDDQALVLAICLKADGRHIGNVKLDKIDWISRACEFGLVIGEKKLWGQGYGSEATYLITQHGFFQLNLRRITIFLAAENTGALRCYAKAGYQTEGRLREAVFLNGKYRDVVVMGQVRRDFQVRSEYEPE